jgi:hypothetical protein
MQSCKFRVIREHRLTVETIGGRRLGLTCILSVVLPAERFIVTAECPICSRIIHNPNDLFVMANNERIDLKERRPAAGQN